ncbi:MAG: tripartite tricarboxylate transporter substrate binding protein [Burkholderiaceae bacterium]|jgi:tripartite-type tricarboxylate transporter receptor subunit TctC|nr:tripartite tricarboxylate transporter substrate binding protein [Burkholderiaceae bacterium]
MIDFSRPLSRRTMLAATMATAVGSTHVAGNAQPNGASTAGGASSNWKPTQPIKIVVPVVGTTNDQLARLVGPELSKALGQPVVIENKGGAGGNIGADFVAKSKPDGYTLLVGYNGPLAINQTLFPKLPYDPIKDFAPITLAVRAPQYLVASMKSDFTSAQDFIAKSKANPQKYSYASISIGSASHLTMEMLKQAAGIDVVHVPYRGAPPALIDLMEGNVQVAFLVPGNVRTYVGAGKIKLLATSGAKRFRSAPDVPTLIELGYPTMDAQSWIGFLAPAGTPQEIVDVYNREMVKILNSPTITQALHDMEYEVVAGSSRQFSDWIASEAETWGAIVKSTGARV